MKRIVPALIAGLLALTACNTAEGDPSGPYESHEQLINAINSHTELECDPEPVENNRSSDTNETWDSMRCAEGSIVHYLRSDGAKTSILDWLAENDTSKTRVALGDDWVFVGDHQQASAIRNALDGVQPNLASRTPTPAPAPTPTGASFKISCDDEEGDVTDEFASPEEAWDELSMDQRVDCKGRWGWAHRDGAHTHHDYTDSELEALETADYEDRSLPLLYGRCAESHLGDTEGKYPWTASQINEVRGALALCPDHPERDIIEERMAEPEQAEAQRDQGERFGNGTYRVGEDIQPGTYVVEVGEAFDGCYWQRLDASGNTIDNNFISSGFRAEVTIAASDHSFNTKRCGEWVKQ